jgi:hypothetical protein
MLISFTTTATVTVIIVLKNEVKAVLMLYITNYSKSCMSLWLLYQSKNY